MPDRRETVAHKDILPSSEKLIRTGCFSPGSDRLLSRITVSKGSWLLAIRRFGPRIRSFHRNLVVDISRFRDNDITNCAAAGMGT